jgi:hypothetical protein
MHICVCRYILEFEYLIELTHVLELVRLVVLAIYSYIRMKATYCR